MYEKLYESPERIFYKELRIFFMGLYIKSRISIIDELIFMPKTGIIGFWL